MANTTADKLTRLRDTKNAIKQAIINKGQTVSENDTFNSYATKINNIDTVDAQAKTVTPTTSQQIIEPDQNYNALSSVTVNAVTSAIDSNIQSDNIKSGVTILGVTGDTNVVDTTVGLVQTPANGIHFNSETGYYEWDSYYEQGSLTTVINNTSGTSQTLVLQYKGVKVSSAESNNSISLDGVKQGALSNSTNYTNYNITIPTGTHTVTYSMASGDGRTTFSGKFLSDEQAITTNTVISGYTGFVNGQKITGTAPADGGVSEALSQSY